MIESLSRSLLVAFVVCVWIVMGTAFWLPKAHASDDDYKPKPKPAPAQVASPSDRKDENLWGATVVSGLATTALRGRENGALWAFGGTVAAAAVIEAAQPGAYKGENVWYAVGGAALGTIGTCKLLLNKGFVGCALSFK